MVAELGWGGCGLAAQIQTQTSSLKPGGGYIYIQGSLKSYSHTTKMSTIFSNQQNMDGEIYIEILTRFELQLNVYSRHPSD